MPPVATHATPTLVPTVPVMPAVVMDTLAFAPVVSAKFMVDEWPSDPFYESFSTQTGSGPRSPWEYDQWDSPCTPLEITGPEAVKCILCI